MPQRYSDDYPYNAELFSRAILQASQGFQDMAQILMTNKFREEQLRGSELERIRAFMQLPPEKRKELLKQPAFRKSMLRALDPHVFSKHKEKREGPAPTDEDVMALGEPTGAELMEMVQRSMQLGKATAEMKKAESETRVQDLKEGLTTGKEKPTKMNLLGAFDIKDPINAILFADVDEKELKDIAELTKGAGPLQVKKDTQEWFQKLVDQGMPSGPAMRNAIAIAKGDFDKVDKNVKGKVQQELSISMMNAVSRRREVQNTIENSKANMTMEIQRTLGYTTQDAQKVMEDLRAGRVPRVDSTALQQLMAQNQVLKAQEIEKNKNTILNDQAGLGDIRSALGEMAKVYATTTSGMFGKGKQIAGQMQKLQDEYTKRLAQRYGIDLKEDPGFAETVLKPLMAQTFQNYSTALETEFKAGKAATVFGVRMTKDAFDAMKSDFEKSFGALKDIGKVVPPASVMPGAPAAMAFAAGTPQAQHTPEQQKVMKSVFEGVLAALQDPNTPEEQKARIREYVTNVLMPAYNDPRLFNTIFTRPQQ